MKTTIWLAANKGGSECLFQKKPWKNLICGNAFWDGPIEGIRLPKGTIEKLIGKKLTWKDKPFKYKGFETNKTTI